MNRSLSATIEPTPAQLAGAVRAVAGAAERHGWPLERVVEALEMLGIDPGQARVAKHALKRSLRQRQALVGVPTLKTGPRPAAVRSAPAPVLVRAGTRNAVGKFVTAEVCTKGLHEMSPENVIIRPDKVARQCKACTYARRKADRVKLRASGRTGGSSGTGGAVSGAPVRHTECAMGISAAGVGS